MVKQVKIERSIKVTCDKCEAVAEFNSERECTWLTIGETSKIGLRVFEKPSKLNRHETFHIPGKEEKIFCSRKCLRDSLVYSVELFMSELDYSIKGQAQVVHIK